MKRRLISIFSFALLICTVSAQIDERQILQSLDAKLEEKSAGFTSADLTQTDIYSSLNSSVVHAYFHPTIDGIIVKNLLLDFHTDIEKEWDLIHIPHDDFLNIERQASFSLSPIQAFDAYTQLKNLKIRYNVVENSTNLTQISSQDASEDIKVEKVYYYHEEQNELVSAYKVDIYTLSAQNWWVAYIDAVTGALLEEYDRVIHCSFDIHEGHKHSCHNNQNNTRTEMGGTSNVYNVFALGIESPNHGNRTLECEPAFLDSSPNGWHETNANSYTDTRGNNVDAYEDRDANNSPGYRPDGGDSLLFDFPLDPNIHPEDNEDAIISNLFYWNNLMHDVWYQYGFDEPSGNFQENNNGNGGSGSDYVNAEAQDGSGTNNANFSTPTDGGNPRMQMFLWSAGTADLEINSPGNVSGGYDYAEANFGPNIDTPMTHDIVLAYDANQVDSTLVCDTVTNGSEISGKIALVDRGDCFFEQKVVNCEEAGAVAVIVCNNIPGDGVFAMGATNEIDDPNIPSIMLSYEDCQTIRMELQNGLNGTIEASPPPYDSDLDAGIICHEYGHGVSIRLTGGPGNSGCLNNAEQMGEGWSDYLGLVMTQLPEDTHDKKRGIGTYVLDEPATGDGIRPSPYSTDFAINDYTYGNLGDGNISQPHGVGFIWCTMIWDLTWSLDNNFGHNDDIYDASDSAGNIVAMQLVIEAMKLQPCNPGFVNGRDAILEADTLLYGGIHSCVIWSTFARRGLGFSASQGSSGSRSDGTEAFDIPEGCHPMSYEELFVSPNPCDDDNLSISGTIITDDYNAQIGIESDGLVPAAGDVLFTAGDSITLKDLFEVELNAIFEAKIEPCED